jgi:hypothetical protein
MSSGNLGQGRITRGLAMTADLALHVSTPQAIVAVVAVLLLGSSSVRAADPDSPAPARVKLAARSVDADPAGFTLGRPVVVTRADLESPLGRVRGLEPDTDTTGQLRQADPAFKAILLTPRGSTGRPAQPIMPDVVLTEPEVKQTTTEPEVKKTSTEPDSKPHGMKLQSHNLSAPVTPPPNAMKERATARPSQQPAKSKEAAAVAVRGTAPPPRAPVRNVASAPAPRFGAAEIGATRAFTRF